MVISFKKFRFQKKYVAFFTVVPLLVVASSVRLDCPIDGGTGYLSSMPAMENVTLTEVAIDQKYVVREICGAYIVYKYDISLSLENRGSELAEGWVKLILRETAKGTVMDIQYVAVVIPANTAIGTTYTVWFGTGLDLPGASEVHAEVVTDQIPDAICDGTGKVALNTWLLVNGLKDNFQEIARLQEQFKPPVFVPAPGEGGEATE